MQASAPTVQVRPDASFIAPELAKMMLENCTQNAQWHGVLSAPTAGPVRAAICVDAAAC
ncbi:hypothetical protein SPHV1_360103 [Novosphingobium sp. KN65.2]|nr:hypothetical protein SPHV1_360103 [Novosphingobium sp. KN65.2]